MVFCCYFNDPRHYYNQMADKVKANNGCDTDLILDVEVDYNLAKPKRLEMTVVKKPVCK